VTVVLDDVGERVLLVRRHRFIVDRWLWELPGGYVDEGESPAAAAVREVEEETGGQPVGDFRGGVVPDPGRTTTVVAATVACRTMTARSIRATLNACES